MNAKIYKECDKLFEKLYSNAEDFKNLIDKGLEVKYRVGNLGNEGTNLKENSIITFSDIFMYEVEDSILYKVFDTNTFSCIKVVNSYPKKEEVLIKKKDFDTWRIGKPSDYFVGVLKEFNRRCNSNRSKNINWIHMVGEDLVLSLLSPNTPSEDYVYGVDKNLDDLFEHIAVISNRFSFDIKDIYWFTDGTYSRIKARRHNDGESTLVIS